MAIQKTADVNTPCAAYEQMEKDWEVIRALRGGTRTMRDAAGKFLPQEPKETDPAYSVRLKRSFLFPALEKTIKGLTGQVFRKAPTLGKDVPPTLADWAENIDSAGRHLQVFAKDVFEAALADGITHIHVDYPRTEKGLTLADERIIGARPYFRHVFADQVIGWWTKPINGIETLTEVRIRETVRRQVGEWGEETVNCVRVLRPGEYFLYEEKKDDTWDLVEEGATPPITNEIPFVSIYTNRKGVMLAEPPLMGLAFMNICHWQSSSDQRNILRIARVPMLFGSGWDPGGDIDVGVNRSIIVKESGASLGWVEHQGGAIAAGKEDLEALKEEMAIIGLEMLTRRPGNETATSRAITKAEADSSLASMCLALKDGIEMALEFAAKWANLGEDGGSVEVNTDFGLGEDMTTKINTLLNMRTNRDISRETFLKEIVKLGILPDDFKPDDEGARLSAEEPEVEEWSALEEEEQALQGV